MEISVSQNVNIEDKVVTSFIGPSVAVSTFLTPSTSMVDLVPSARVEG